MGSIPQQGYSIRVNIKSEGQRNFGGNFAIKRVSARTDWARPTLHPYIEVHAEAIPNGSEPSRMQTISLLMEPDVLTHCLDIFQSDLNSKIRQMENRVAASQLRQIESGMMLIATKLALLIEADPRWRELVALFITDADDEIGSASELASRVRSEIEFALNHASSVEESVDGPTSERSADDMLRSISEALETAMAARHARSLAVELRGFFEEFRIDLGGR